MIGSGTALADDPALTCRLPGLDGRSPVRVVLDGRLRLRADQPPGAHGARRADLGGHPRRRRAAAARGARALWRRGADRAGGRRRAPWISAAALAALAARGLTRVLVEGGGAVAAALLRARLVDRLVWFQAPLVIGGDGLAAVAELGLDALADCPRFRPAHGTALAPDAVQAYIVDTE